MLSTEGRNYRSWSSGIILYTTNTKIVILYDLGYWGYCYGCAGCFFRYSLIMKAGLHAAGFSHRVRQPKTGVSSITRVDPIFVKK